MNLIVTTQKGGEEKFMAFDFIHGERFLAAYSLNDGRMVMLETKMVTVDLEATEEMNNQGKKKKKK